jgi:hypothetical protein
MALRCFLAAFLTTLFCCLADFLAAICDWRPYSAAPVFELLAGIDHATLKATSSVKTAICFTQNFLSQNMNMLRVYTVPQRRSSDQMKHYLANFFACAFTFAHLFLAAAATAVLPFADNTRFLTPDIRDWSNA